MNATGTAPPFEDHLGALDDLVAPYRPEDLVLRGRHTYEIAANWKLVSENYHECYHCPLIHPELCQVSNPTSGDNYALPGAWVGGTMHFKGDAVTMSMDGTSQGRPIEGAPQDTVLYVQLFPNLLISGHPDYVMTHRVLPLAPDRTWIECSWYFPGADIDPTYAMEFWDLTNSQDWKACELVQRGLNSPHFSPGPFAPNEDAVHQWVQMIGRGYLGIAPERRGLSTATGRGRIGRVTRETASYDDTAVPRGSTRAAFATAAVFALNGSVIAAWISRLPATRDRLDADPRTIGLTLLTLGLGSLVAMPFVGRLAHRWSSGPVVIVTSVVAGLGLVAAAVTPDRDHHRARPVPHGHVLRLVGRRDEHPGLLRRPHARVATTCRATTPAGASARSSAPRPAPSPPRRASPSPCTSPSPRSSRSG